MCEVITTSIMAALGGGGATAAGAAAGAATAATAGGALAKIGTWLSIGGSLYQGIEAKRAADENAANVAQQRKTEQQLNATKDQRERAKFRSAIAKQTAELVARGVSLDSPTAVFLGQSAAQEMSFNSQSIRSTGQARDAELSAQERAYRARGRSSLLKGGLSAAGAWLNREPDAWPGLAA